MCNGSKLLRVPEQCSVIGIYHSLFIQSPFNGHLGYFLFGAFLNKAALPILAQDSCGHMHLLRLGVSRSGIAESQDWCSSKNMCKKL